jgi:hypothetical protein
MAKSLKALSRAVVASGWASSVFATWWGAMITSVGTVLLLVLAAGARILTDPSFLGAAFIGTLVLWTYIGLVWLITRRPGDIKALRYGITFEGVTPTFNPTNHDGALSFALLIRNFSPVPLRYFVEEFDVYIDTRTLPTRYEKNSLQGILSRGAIRQSTAIPFKLEHIREFMGKRVEGTLDFSITYGDADKIPVRRLRMSTKLVLEFPNIPDLTSFPAQGILPMMFPLGFIAAIATESDEPLDS